MNEVSGEPASNVQFVDPVVERDGRARRETCAVTRSSDTFIPDSEHVSDRSPRDCLLHRDIAGFEPEDVRGKEGDTGGRGETDHLVRDFRGVRDRLFHGDGPLRRKGGGRRVKMQVFGVQTTTASTSGAVAASTASAT